jgi:hypothetical protein
MPTSILIPYDATGTTRLDLRAANGTGSPLSGTATLVGNNREIADVYTATLSNVSGSDADVTLSAASGKGPYHGRVTTATFDGSGNTDILPGVSLPLTSSAVSNGWTFTVSVGIWAGLLTAGNPAGTQESWEDGVDDPGTTAVDPGDPGFLGKLLIKNVGAEAVANAKALLLPRIKVVNVASPPLFHEFYPVDTTPSERTSSGKVIPIKFRGANLDTAATPDEIDIEMSEDGGTGWATFDNRDVDTGTAGTSIDHLMDETTRYQVRESGAYTENAVYTVSSSATNSSVDNVLVFNVRHVWIAPDNGSGSPGTWTQDEVVLTEAGESAGVITPAGSAILWVKLDVGALAELDQSPFPADVTTEYSLTGEAGWED